jgi:hypothetical protein
LRFRAVFENKTPLDVGLPTAIIRDLLPCLGGPRETVLEAIDPDMHGRLIDERDRMDQRIISLSKNRDAINAYLAEVGPPVLAQ